MKRKVDPAAVALVNQTTYLAAYSDNSDTAKKALQLLDSATAIDSNYIGAYRIKLMYLIPLKEYQRILTTLKNMIRIQPNGIESYTTTGLIYEKLNDSISARPYFEKSFEMSKSILDTMQQTNKYYLGIATTQATNLVMLDKYEQGEALFKKICDNETDEGTKKFLSSYLNKNKRELISLFTSPPDEKIAH